MKDRLKPCPFCGGEAEIFKDFIECTICCIQFPSIDDVRLRTKEELIILWNTRPKEPSGDVSVGELSDEVIGKYLNELHSCNLGYHGDQWKRRKHRIDVFREILSKTIALLPKRLSKEEVLRRFDEKANKSDKDGGFINYSYHGGTFYSIGKIKSWLSEILGEGGGNERRNN